MTNKKIIELKKEDISILKTNIELISEDKFESEIDKYEFFIIELSRLLNVDIDITKIFLQFDITSLVSHLLNSESYISDSFDEVIHADKFFNSIKSILIKLPNISSDLQLKAISNLFEIFNSGIDFSDDKFQINTDIKDLINNTWHEINK